MKRPWEAFLLHFLVQSKCLRVQKGMIQEWALPARPAGAGPKAAQRRFSLFPVLVFVSREKRPAKVAREARRLVHEAFLRLLVQFQEFATH